MIIQSHWLIICQKKHVDISYTLYIYTYMYNYHRPYSITGTDDQLVDDWLITIQK